HSLPQLLSLHDALPIFDRIGFKTGSVVSDLLAGATIALIPALHHTVGLEFWQLLILVFFAGLFATPGMTARQSLVPDLAELAGLDRKSTRLNSSHVKIS